MRTLGHFELEVFVDCWGGGGASKKTGPCEATEPGLESLAITGAVQDPASLGHRAVTHSYGCFLLCICTHRHTRVPAHPPPTLLEHNTSSVLPGGDMTTSM